MDTIDTVGQIMLRLPRILPAHLLSELERAVDTESLESLLSNVSHFVMNLFSAEDVVAAYSSKTPRDISVFATRRKNVPCDFGSEFCTRWAASGIHAQVLTDISNRLSPVSYSAFSWPYRATISDAEKLYQCPRDYTLLFPFASHLIVIDEKELPFQGYLAALFDRFPEFGDDQLQLIVTLPHLLSEIIATITCHARLTKQELITDAQDS